MEINSIVGAFIQQANLDKEPEAGRPDRSRNNAVRGDEVIQKSDLLSSIIPRNEIAREFVHMDGAADPMAQEVLQNSGPAADEDTQRSKYEEPAKNESLKAIVQDDTKWNYFVQSVFLKAPQSEAAKSMRMQIIKGFESGDWSQIKNDTDFEKLIQKTGFESGNAEFFSGEEKRIDLWLENSDFFKQLFTAVRNGDLFSRPNLLTDSLLVDFVLTLPEDTE
jgi:hypothetical protein